MKNKKIPLTKKRFEFIIKYILKLFNKVSF